MGNDILGFDSSGRVVNKPDHGNLDWVRVCEQSSKVITFIDLAGHEKYLKTTVFGMTGHAPGEQFFFCSSMSDYKIINLLESRLELIHDIRLSIFLTADLIN